MLDAVAVQLIGIGGAVGALARHAVGVYLGTGTYPWATFVVNVLGSVLLAVVTFAGSPSAVRLLVGIGACGAFTTFSSFAVETVQLWTDGERLVAVLNAGGTLVAALAAVGVGWLIATL
jgi:CrcB protein